MNSSEDAAATTQPTVVYNYYGTVNNFYSCHIDQLVTSESLGNKRPREEEQTTSQEESSQVVTAAAQSIEGAAGRGHRLSIIHPGSHDSMLADQPTDLPEDLSAQYEAEKQAVYQKFGRRGKDRYRTLCRLKALGEVWFKFYTISKERKKFIDQPSLYMLPWTVLRSSVSPDDKPTPFHLHRELVHILQTNVNNTREGVEFYLEHLADPHPHVRLKALLCLRQISLKVASFRHYLRVCVSRVPANDSLVFGCSSEAAQLLVQARKNLADVLAVDDVLLEAKNSLLASRCEGFGTRTVSFGGDTSSSSVSIAASNPIANFLAETVTEVADDFRSKGAIATIKDATIDVADLLVEGLEGLTGWMRQVLPSPQPATVHEFGAYKQQPGDQFAALFGEPTDTRKSQTSGSLVSLAQEITEQETAPNTPELPALLLERTNEEASFLD